jgi:TIR domain
MSNTDGRNDSAHFLISYDHETPSHRANVLTFRDLLRAEGFDVRIDADVEEERQDWPQWMTREIVAAERVLMVVSPRYRDRFEADGPVGGGRGVEIESKIIREEITRDPAGSLRKFVPVLLPGFDVEDIPRLLQPYSATHYRVSQLAASGVAEIARLLRRRVDGSGPAVSPPPAEATGALWLSATGLSQAAADDVVRAFAAGREVGRYTSDDTSGALVTAGSADVVALLQRLGRTLPGVLPRLRRPTGPRVTVGGHLDVGTGAAAAGAQWTAAGGAARRLHAAPRVGAVIAVSAELRAAMSAVPPAILAAYREFPRDGETGSPVHLSAPGLSRCPDLPEETDPAPSAPVATGPSIVGDHGRIYVNSVDRSENLHIAAGRDVIMMRDLAR